MRQIVIILFRPIYNSCVLGLVGVIALSCIIEAIKRAIIGTAYLVSVLPSIVIPAVLFILALLFMYSARGYKPTAAEQSASKKRGVIWGIVMAVFFFLSATLFNNVAWDNLQYASADTAQMAVSIWRTNLYILTFVTFLFAYLVGKFSYKLKLTVD